MRLSVLAFAIPLVCGGCVVQGTPDGGLAIDPAVRVVRTAPTYTAMPPPPPVQNYVAPEPTDIPGPPVYAPPGVPYPPPNTSGLPDWTPNQ